MKITNLIELQETYNISEKVIDYFKKIHREQKIDQGYLTELQKAVFSNPYFWDDSKNIIIQGRTSSGKTLLAQIATAYFGGKEADISESARNKIIYLVPLRAMVSEKRGEFKKLLQDTLDWRVYASSSDYQDHDEDILNSNFEVAIIIYEKFFALLAQDNQFVRNCGLIVVDELQMMNDEDRGPKLEISLTKVKAINPYCKIMGLTTTQCDVSEIQGWLDAAPIINLMRPKALEEYVVWPDRSGASFHFYMHEELADGQLPQDETPESSGSSQDADSKKRTTIDLKGQHLDISEKDKFVEEKMIPCMVTHVRSENPSAKIIVFMNSRKNVKSIAIQICNYLQRKENFHIDMEDEHVQDFNLSDDEFALEMAEETLPYGVAFHHGGFSRTLRDFVEDQFRKSDGLVDIVVATETLAIGVNMPADVVILAGVTKPRTNQYKNEMRSHEYKNYVGRAGRLGKSSAEKGKSYLLAPSEAKANDYWNRYVKAQQVKISSALRKLPQKKQIPFFFNLIDNSSEAAIEGFDVDTFNELIQITLAYNEDKDKDNLPGKKFIGLLEKYELIEPVFGKADNYVRSRIGNELASYALALDTIEIIKSTCQCLIEASETEFGETNRNIKREQILHFMEHHFLDILYCLSGTSELINVFVQNHDEVEFTQKVLRYVNQKKNTLLESLPLWKILEDVFVHKKSLPNPSKSFSLKRAACVLEWMKGKSIKEIKSETGLTYITLGDLDRLGDAFAYLWEAMARMLSTYLSAFGPYKIMLIRMAGRLKYGVEQDLILLASRHVEYVSRNQLIELKKEAVKHNLSPEQYVRDLRHVDTQKALRTKQFLSLASELNEHYHSRDAIVNIVSEAEKLKREEIIDDTALSVVEAIDERRELSPLEIENLLQCENCNLNVQKQDKCVVVSFSNNRIKIYSISAEHPVDKDTFVVWSKSLNSSEKDVTHVFLSKEGFVREKLEGIKKEMDVFLSATAFAKLYLLSLKKSSSLFPFFQALLSGYSFIPDEDMALNAYITNFIPEKPEILQPEKIEDSRDSTRFVLHVLQDKAKCHKIVSSLVDRLRDKFSQQQFEFHFIVWSDTVTNTCNQILKDDDCKALVFIDSDFNNQRFIHKIINLLTPFLNDGKVFMLYLNEESENLFLQKYPVFGNANSVNLETTDSDALVEIAYEALTNETEYQGG